MTPSNPSNSQPLIYRIMDALGVTHLVACINHTHEQSEVEGLNSTLYDVYQQISYDFYYLTADTEIDLDTLLPSDGVRHLILNNDSGVALNADMVFFTNGTLNFEKGWDQKIESSTKTLLKVVRYTEGGSTVEFFITREGVFDF